MNAVSLKPRRRSLAKYGLFQPERRIRRRKRVVLEKSEASLRFSKSARHVFSIPLTYSIFRWAKALYHKLTDHLLTIIEEKDRYRQALGFSKEPGVVVNSGGQTVMDICSEIAETLFLTSEDSIYMKDDLDELGKCVNNRVIALVLFCL